MTNLLLEVNVGLVVGIVLLVLAVVGGIILAIKLNKKVLKNMDNVDWDKINTKGMLKKHTPLLWPKELEFYEMIKSVLPKDFIIVPKLGVDEIVKPNGNLLLFNAVKTEHVDFCIVRASNMEPLVVLDTFYAGISDSTLKELSKPVKKALESVNIPVVKYEILDVPYDKDAVLTKFLDAIDPVTLAQMRKN